MSQSIALGFVALLATSISTLSEADDFVSVQFDARRDVLVARMLYDGTNPNHRFKIKWGSCDRLGNDKGYQLSADVTDDQWNDTTARTYTKTVLFSLASVTCRPVDITLRTAPRFFYTVHVP